MPSRLSKLFSRTGRTAASSSFLFLSSFGWAFVLLFLGDINQRIITTNYSVHETKLRDSRPFTPNLSVPRTWQKLSALAKVLSSVSHGDLLLENLKGLRSHDGRSRKYTTSGFEQIVYNPGNKVRVTQAAST